MARLRHPPISFGTASTNQERTYASWAISKTRVERRRANGLSLGKSLDVMDFMDKYSYLIRSGKQK